MAAFTTPTFAQVVALPAVHEATVPQDWIDENGHMNISHFFDIGGAAAWRFCQGLGLQGLYESDPPTGLFTTEHHLTYLSELRLGERLSAHVRCVDVGPKSVHLITLILDRERERVATVFEVVLVHVDMTARKAAPFPDEFREALETAVAADRELDWVAPVCGAMGVRR